MSWLKAFKWKQNRHEATTFVKTLGLERRQNFRVKYPERGALGDLPWVTFAGYNFKIQNISIGGCCLFDPDEILGPAVGQTLTLSFHWKGDSHDVQSRIVSRVDSRRHVQFLNFSERNQNRVRKHIEPAVRGAALRKVESGSSSNLKVEACELWISLVEDSVTLFDHPHLAGSISYRGQDYLCYRNAFPVFGNDRKRIVSPELYDDLILFLSNVPNPTAAMRQFLAELCLVGQERFRL
jgi:hypothetical protein